MFGYNFSVSRLSNFVTNSYGESWVSSCEKSWISPEPMSLNLKKNESEIENAWDGYVTRQLT